MNKYTIYCTIEQTKKAIELGAPIEILPNYTEYRVFPLVKCKDGNERPCVIPIAEQMIGWLEEQGIFIEVAPSFNEDGTHLFIYYVGSDINSWIDSELKHIAGELLTYPSRKEATLAAIDAALEYLTNNKK